MGPRRVHCPERRPRSWWPALRASHPRATILYRGVGTSSRTPPPAQILFISSHVPVGEAPSCHPPPAPPVMPTAVRGPGPWTETISFPKRGGIGPYGLPSYPPSPTKTSRCSFPQRPLTPWAQPFPPHLHKSQLEGSRSPERGASSWYGRGRNPSRGPRGSLAEMEREHPRPAPPLPELCSLTTLRGPNLVPGPQSRLTCDSRSLKPGQAPADGSSVHFTNPSHAPSLLSVDWEGSLFP